MSNRRILILLLTVFYGIAGTGIAWGTHAHHDLSVSLFPQRSELKGWDRIHIQRSPNGPIALLLSPRARIQSVRIDGREQTYTFKNGRVVVDLNQDMPAGTTVLSIRYTCRFDDPAPLRPVNTDNPGYGVSGTISTSGTFLLSGAGWYPRIVNIKESFDLRVDGPQDTLAITAGRLVGSDHKDGRTVSRWRIDTPVEGLSLSAGSYVSDRQTADGFTASTYFFPENRHLSARYLEASLRYLKQYSDRFGAYPFDGFAVVENFFPTGYGFPGYTLIGGRVLRLPFIPETSLPHEIVHNWWGNGVLVDFTSGNWCEGLTAYTADYLNKALASSTAAADYRRQALRNYASLVSPSDDFPLDHFRTRTDPVTKAVGYDKATMVFHMLHQVLGDRAFWDALRNLYRDFLFKHASWMDLQQIFEQQAGRSLDRFFRQWIHQAGAPQIRLENVQRESVDDGYRTTGRLVQTKPYYTMTVQLILDTEDKPIERTVKLTGRQTKFEIVSDAQPHALSADPDFHLFRRLSSQELPPTVNTLKGSSSVIVVITTRLGRFGRPIAQYFTRAMGIDPIRAVDEADYSPAETTGNDLLIIGMPERPQLIDLLPQNLALSPKGFKLTGQPYQGAADVLFFVTRQPGSPENVVGLLHPLSPAAANEASLKIPHYGRYSYLAFSNGRNQIKGTWKVKNSPVTVRWAKLKHQNQGATP